MKVDAEQMPPAMCDLCRAQGGCILGFPRSWRYWTTRPDPYTGHRHTKMYYLTQPCDANGFEPPVETFGGRTGRRIVGHSMCSYERGRGGTAPPPQKPIKSAPALSGKGPAPRLGPGDFGPVRQAQKTPTPPMPPATRLRRKPKRK